MHWIDLTIFIVYMLAMLGIGFLFLHLNKSADDYYVGGRKMSSIHIGLSVVATDVGGGFSIGLGGLGFVMGLSGSWMLFTGLIGAWMASALLIPKVFQIARQKNMYTFPQILEHFFDYRVAIVAALISGIGYIGFSSSQMLAGAKLASATFDGLDLQQALIIMGTIAVIYTVLGGLKAVIYTDTVQWIILMSGLVFIGIPLGYQAVGGIETIREVLKPEFLQLTNITWQRIVKWLFTILPIWFVGMTLYQRIYASRDEKTARRAWLIAGVFEYPVMAFMGVMLGLFARVALETGLFVEWGYSPDVAADEEMGLPILLRNILPVGLMGLMMSAYFSAILSTADSCLMAASGNLQTDMLDKLVKRKRSKKEILRTSQVLTLAIGTIALILALKMTNVLDLMLYSYAFMVSGLFVPVLVALYGRNKSTPAAIVAMIGGGTTTVLLSELPVQLPYGLDANVFGISASAILYFGLASIFKNQRIIQKDNPA
ncbi:MAG: sodium:solute symporter family protein [Bacteroidales bacterium]|nr:sodium:solute symporter family protein [Bacteroidales bacterium]